ncbi:aminotransferase class IV, partial [Leyella stercorea]|uniref:aminotransferase class IV n=1 Tax=Leyella stercorea TaxID=363265 RepID=UPI002FD9AAAF
VKNGLLTDTSFTNVAVFDGERWLTPKYPLLLGTKRASLLERQVIKEADISVETLMNAQKVSLINAMIDLGEIEISIANIIRVDRY